MENEQLLRELSAKIGSGEISQTEVLHRLNLSTVKPSSHFAVTKILYALGAAIVVTGIIIFVKQIWGDIGPVGRIAVTLGLGLLMTGLGSMLSLQKPEDKLGPLFHVMGGALIPGGVLVTLSELSVDKVSLWPVAISLGAVFAFYLLLNTVHRHAVLTFFSIANGTAFVYLLVGAMVQNTDWPDDIFAYLTMVMGISYLLLAHASKGDWNKKLIGILHFFGSSGFLGAAFSRVLDSGFWQLLYFPLVFGGFFLAIRMKSTSILAMSVIFLISHISYITSEYFADSLGWPISLVIMGFLFIGLGYASISINKKYIKDQD